MSEVQVVARYTISIGSEGEVMALIGQLAQATRAEPGCRWIEIYREVGNDRHLALIERYVSREALDEHQRSEHFQRLVVTGCAPRLDRRVVDVFDVPEATA